MSGLQLTNALTGEVIVLPRASSGREAFLERFQHLIDDGYLTFLRRAGTVGVLYFALDHLTKLVESRLVRKPFIAQILDEPAGYGTVANGATEDPFSLFGENQLHQTASSARCAAHPGDGDHLGGNR